MYRDMGSDLAWSDEAHMGANVFDVLQIANWQRADKAPRPTPMQRPGDAHRAESKKAQIEAKAKAFAARQAVTPPAAEARPRDARGRFTKKEG